MSVGRQGTQALLELFADVVGPLVKAFVGHDLEVGYARCARGMVSRVRVAGSKQEAGLFELLADGPGHDDAGQREVARRDALGEGDQVGGDAEGLGAEPFAGPTEAADHLIEDEQCPVVVTQATQALEVAVGRWEDAAGTLQRLGQDGGNTVTLLGEDRRHGL